MRVSSPFVLLAVFLATQSECAPISPSGTVHFQHVGHVNLGDSSLPIVGSAHSLNGLSGPLDSTGGLSTPPNGGLPVISSVPNLNSLPTGGLTGRTSSLNPLTGGLTKINSVPALSSISSIAAHTKRGLSNLPMIGAISGINGNAGGLSNPLSGGLPMMGGGLPNMSSVPRLSSLSTGLTSGPTSGGSGLNPLVGGLPVMNSIPGLSSSPLPGLIKRSLSNLPINGIPGLDGNAGGLTNPLSGGLPTISSVPGFHSLPIDPIPGLTGGVKDLNSLGDGLPMMGSNPGFSSFPNLDLNKRGLSELPMLSAVSEFGGNADGLSNPLSGALPLSSVPGFSSLPFGSISGLTGNPGGLNPLSSELPMKNTIPRLSSLPISGLTRRGSSGQPTIAGLPMINTIPVFSKLPIWTARVPLFGSFNDGMSGFVTSSGVQ